MLRSQWKKIPKEERRTKVADAIAQLKQTLKRTPLASEWDRWKPIGYPTYQGSMQLSGCKSWTEFMEVLGHTPSVFNVVDPQPKYEVNLVEPIDEHAELAGEEKDFYITVQASFTTRRVILTTMTTYQLL